MSGDNKFGGFSQETFKFIADLEMNNNKEWFEENRSVFEDRVLGPAQDFVVEMGERLKTLSPKIVADPRTDKSIFRLHRDTRFSKDKAPYKTHVGILFWEGRGKKLENSGYYLQLNKSSIFLGAGFYIFPNRTLKAFRDALSDARMGRELAGIIKGITGNTPCLLGGKHYKRIPRGFAPGRADPELLLHNGLYAYRECPPPREVYSSRFLDYCFDIFSVMSPLHKWLTRVNPI